MKDVSENVTLSNFIADLGNKYPEVFFSKLTKIAKAAYNFGKAEALNDLPRWKKWGNGVAGNAEGHPIALVKGAGGLRFTSVLCATGEKYIMLDDLMKLPGFKE